MVTAAVPLLAATLTRDPFGVSIVTAATYAAWLVVGLPAGVLVDRWPRRLTMVLSDLTRAALLGGLSVAVLAHDVSLPLLVVVVFLIGTAGCFFDPAAQAAIPNLVGRDQNQLAHANSRIWTLDMLGRSLIGPPLGAALFAAGTALPFGVNAATFVISALLLSGLRQLGSGEPAANRPTIATSLVEGIFFLWTHPDLRALTVGMGTYNLAYNTAYATLVLYAQDRLHLDDRGFGLLLATMAVGGLLGAWAAPWCNRRLSLRAVYAAALGVQALGWLIVALVATALTSGAGLALIGLASMVVTVVGAAARQSLTPDRLLGRVSAGTRVVGVGTAALGALLGGAIASSASVQGAIAGAALICAAGALAYSIAARRPDQQT